jgi:hypothetical protein
MNLGGKASTFERRVENIASRPLQKRVLSDSYMEISLSCMRILNLHQSVICEG